MPAAICIDADRMSRSFIQFKIIQRECWSSAQHCSIKHSEAQLWSDPAQSATLSFYPFATKLAQCNYSREHSNHILWKHNILSVRKASAGWPVGDMAAVQNSNSASNVSNTQPVHASAGWRILFIHIFSRPATITGTGSYPRERRE